MNRSSLSVALFLLAISSFAGTSLAGPLNPPVGAVSSTMKTLTEVEPRIAINATNTPGDADSVFKITEPGSYYLTGNITGVSGKHGIEVIVSNVTIDLNGFKVAGVANSLSGIAGTATILKDISVENGTVNNWTLYGIDMGASTTQRITFKNIRAISNGSSGLRTIDRAEMVDCVAEYNAGAGFDTYSDCKFVRCDARNNTLNGFDTTSNTQAFECNASNNGGMGFYFTSSANVSRCTARSNLLGGLTVAAGSLVDKCVANNNVGFGIACSSNSIVTGNTCSENSSGANSNGAGILITSGRNRVEGNMCAQNAIGIAAVTSQNFVSRNICGDNTLNWSIAAGNRCLVVNSIAAGAINGNSGGVSPGSNDPNANFTN